MKKISGIYSITNIVNNKVYYGSSYHINRRITGHKRQLNTQKHYNSHLQRAWDKYGENNFIFNIEEEVDENELLKIEQCYLDWCNIFPFLSYNIAKSAESLNKGQVASLETRRKLSIAATGRKMSEESKRKIGFASRGRKLSDEAKQKIRECKLGKPSYLRTDTIKLKCSESAKGKSHGVFDKNIYTFYNRITNEIFTGIRKEFIKKYDLPNQNVSRIISKERKSVHDWIIKY